MSRSLMLAAVLAGGLLSAPPATFAIDETAADRLVRKSKCLKCHRVDSEKDGPSFQETAEKYKGKPEGEAKVTKMITEPSKVKVDGDETDHETLRSKDPADVSNVVQWILTR